VTSLTMAKKATTSHKAPVKSTTSGKKTEIYQSPANGANRTSWARH
jgi:hypothetical protein